MRAGGGVCTAAGACGELMVRRSVAVLKWIVVIASWPIAALILLRIKSLRSNNSCARPGWATANTTA